MKILGLSCSLRNARFGVGCEALIGEIKQLADESALIVYLEKQTKIRVDDFIAAGRNQNLAFDKIYGRLRKMRGDRGLSNSEAALVAGLWGAHMEGAEIEQLGLGTYFHMTGEHRFIDDLRARILGSDALLVSGPVYFGDRGSLAQQLFEFLYSDPECANHIRNRLYAGIAVGAKRNGGQESTLIYQIVDATNLNMLAVGNNDETTSQYGGTAVGGDVGTLYKDHYGITTSIGTGRRLAKVGTMLQAGNGNSLKSKAKIHIWLLQDTPDRHGYNRMLDIASTMMVANPQIEAKVIDFTQHEIYRCIACDICPIRVGRPEEYRCIINAKKDAFVNLHSELLEADGILLGAYSPVHRLDVRSVYQSFMERTRYLRRDDYVLSEKLVAPLVISEINANQNLHIRMLTSFIRHQTVLHHPLIGMEFNGQLLNTEILDKQAVSFAETTIRLTLGKLTVSATESQEKSYNPVGYIISKQKKAEDEGSEAARISRESRRELLNEDRLKRLETATEKT